MKLTEIMEKEKELLLLKDNEEFKMPLAKAVLLTKALNEIGLVTDTYFDLMSRFSQTHTIEETKEYNARLMQEDVEITFDFVDQFLSSN